MKTVYITDTDNGGIDKNFQYILGFQPSSGVMILHEGVLQIFLNALYFGKTKNISTELIAQKVGLPELVIEFIELKRPICKSIISYLQTQDDILLSSKVSFSFYTQLEKINREEEKGLTIGLLEEDTFLNKRLVKTEQELAYISEAIRIIDQVFLCIQSLNKKGGLIGMSEKALRVLIIKKIFEFGGDGESFEAVVASGKNSSIPHHFAGEDIIKEGILLIDMGALYDGYCSDFTRTFWVFSGIDQTVSDSHKGVYNKFTEVYNIVKESHLHAYNNTVEGMTESEVDNLSRSVIVDAGFGDFFIHATGHGIGLDVHETPHIAPGKELKIFNQTAFTIEPGIYLPGEFGIRIEDIVFMKDGKLEKVTSIAV